MKIMCFVKDITDVKNIVYTSVASIMIAIDYDLDNPLSYYEK